MTQFRLAPMERTDLIIIDRTENPPIAQRPLLRLDVRTGSLDITYRTNAEHGIPTPVYYGFVREWTVPTTTDAKRFAEAVNAGTLDTLLSRIMAGASSRWDGDNHICDLTDDAQEAEEAVLEWLTGWADTLPEDGGLWDASDWFADGPESIEGLTAATSDEELEALATKLEQGAKADCVVLWGTLETLRRFREQLQEAVGA